MVAFAGKDVVLKIGDGEVSETFTTLGGLKNCNIKVNQSVIEKANVDSGVWRTVLNGAGIRHITIAGEGIFTDSANEEILRAHAFNGTVSNFQCHFGNGDYLQGSFLVRQYQRTGDMPTIETYRIILESAGIISYTAS